MNYQRVIKISLIVLLGAWVILRLAFSSHVFEIPKKVRLIDGNTYLDLAFNLLDRGVYASQTVEGLDQARTPIYPYFAAFVLDIFSKKLAYLALFQLILTIGTCFFVYKIGQVMFSDLVGLAAAWVYVLDPNSLFFALTALSETLFTLFLTISLFFLVYSRKKSQKRWLVASAIMLGLTILVRPIAIWLLIIWSVMILVPNRDKDIKIRLGSALLFFAVTWLVFLPWQLRNFQVADQFSISPRSETTVRYWMIAQGLADAKGISRNQAAQEIANSENENQYILEIFQKYPTQMVLAQIKGIGRTMVGMEFDTWTYLLGVDIESSREVLDNIQSAKIASVFRSLTNNYSGEFFIPVGLLLWGTFYSFWLYVLSAIGLISKRKDVDAYWYLILLVISSAYLLLSPMAAGQARFRIPATPMLAVLAGIGITFIVYWLVNYVRSRQATT